MSYYNKAVQFVAYDVAAATARKTTQVVMLYDGLIKIMQQAKQAITDKKYEERYNLIERATQVVAGLHGCLDFEKGGEVAQLLNDYYSAIDMRLIMIQGNNSIELCDQIVKELKIMRESWVKVDKKAAGEEEAQSAAMANVAADAATQPAAASVSVSV